MTASRQRSSTPRSSCVRRVSVIAMSCKLASDALRRKGEVRLHDRPVETARYPRRIALRARRLFVMRRVLVTGMSGTGKSEALAELERRGFRVVDTDLPGWCRWVDEEEGSGGWLWREDRMAELVAAEGKRPLYVAGCVSNQGMFYDRFEAVVLLSAPAEVISSGSTAGRRTTTARGPASVS